MGLKSFNPSRLAAVYHRPRKSHINQGNAGKGVARAKKRSGGRNNHGEIVIWHAAAVTRTIPPGGFPARTKSGVPATVAGSSTTRIAARTSRCCTMTDGEKRYILHP